MIIKSLTGYYLKTRPRAHRLEGITTKQHSGFVLSKMPKEYPLNAPQRRVKEVAKACGIHKGISRSALVTAMRDCVSSKF